MTKNPKKGGSGLGPAEDLFAEFDAKPHVQALKLISPEIFADHDTAGDEFDGLAGTRPVRTGKVGRPAGSPGRFATDTARYIKSQFGSPVIGAAQFGIIKSPEHLVRMVQFLRRELFISAEKALDFIVAEQKFIAPYVEQALPAKVEVNGTGQFALVVAADSFKLPGDDARQIEAEL